MQLVYVVCEVIVVHHCSIQMCPFHSSLWSLLLRVQLIAVCRVQLIAVCGVCCSSSLSHCQCTPQSTVIAVCGVCCSSSLSHCQCTPQSTVIAVCGVCVYLGSLSLSHCIASTDGYLSLKKKAHCFASWSFPSGRNTGYWVNTYKHSSSC